jgi:rhamnulokinase/L-fuculokinase
MRKVLAFDFGASSGRAIKAEFDGEKITYSEIHRFDNIPIEENGEVHHNTQMIIAEVKKAIEKAGEVDALAFDTWGVDYALFDEEGKLLNEPFHYRDGRTANALKSAEQKMPLFDIYQKTGNQIMNINTLFQLISDENLSRAKKLLFMPDLFSCLLCGNAVCEKTIASTSQLLSPESKTWDSGVLKTFGISPELFAPLTQSASVIGEYKGIMVIAVAGHDTQCAIAAMPCENKNAAFLSCGTWSLIGCETDEPILSEDAYRLELSNELGANGKVNFLKNISGLWLIQETKRDYAKKGESYSYNELEQFARASKPFKCFIDPDSPLLSAHGDLPNKIKAYCKKTNQPVPETVGEIVRCIYESLALKYRLALEQISSCTGREFEVLHLLGGGTKDGFLCRMTADSINIPVIAGPVEATALGNIILQLIALGDLPDVESGRRIIAKSEKLTKYIPSRALAWDEAYEKYKKIIMEEAL